MEQAQTQTQVSPCVAAHPKIQQDVPLGLALYYQEAYHQVQSQDDDEVHQHSAGKLIHSPPPKSRVHSHFPFAWLQHLRAFNNFNSIMAILAGFNMAAVHRLKWTRGSLPEKYEQVCETEIGSSFFNSHPLCVGPCRSCQDDGI